MERSSQSKFPELSHQVQKAHILPLKKPPALSPDSSLSSYFSSSETDSIVQVSDYKPSPDFQAWTSAVFPVISAVQRSLAAHSSEQVLKVIAVSGNDDHLAAAQALKARYQPAYVKTIKLEGSVPPRVLTAQLKTVSEKLAEIAEENNDKTMDVRPARGGGRGGGGG